MQNTYQSNNIAGLPQTTVTTYTVGQQPGAISPTSLSQPSFVQQPTSFIQQPTSFVQQSSSFAQQPGAFAQPGYQQPLYNGSNMMGPTNGLQGDIPLGQTGVNDIELQKRMLDNQHETQMKYADMESDKQKKFEEKAEKHREKAAKWKSKGTEFLVHRHEKKAEKWELRAHQHYIAAEDYKQKAKTIETERKKYDPPADKKKSGKGDDKKAADKKPAADKSKTSPAATQQSKPQQAQTQQQAPLQSQQQPLQQQQQPLQQQPLQQQQQYEPERPKKAIVEPPRDASHAHQQDVSTAALRYAKAEQEARHEQDALLRLQQQTGVGKQ